MTRTLLIPSVVILSGVLGTHAVGQSPHINAQLASVGSAASSKAINEQAFVLIGGIEQWISIRGQDRDNPVILVLHGGPGVSNAPFAPAFIPWEKDFTLVEWDQRGAGRTFGRNGAQGTGLLSIDRLAQDGIELTQHLDHTCRKRR